MTNREQIKMLDDIAKDLGELGSEIAQARNWLESATKRKQELTLKIQQFTIQILEEAKKVG